MASSRRVAVLSALGMILLPSSAAWASMASVSDSDVRYVAAPGESNAVVFTFEGLNVRISDPGATISVGPRCVLDGFDALCETDNFFPEISVDLGDGDDSADLSRADFVQVEGGAGNDEIVGGGADSLLGGGPGNDQLTAHGGDDALYGGGGDDELILGAGEFDMGFGGPGNDTISGGVGFDDLVGDSGDDILRGGSGVDLVFAFGRNLRLTPTALIGQGNDTLVGIESADLSAGNADNLINARTWRGRTTIRTRGGDDVVVGGFGRDIVAAGAGDDRIAGGAGRDLLAGEGGDDLLFSRDRQPDQVGGGPGFDRARVDRLDVTRRIEIHL